MKKKPAEWGKWEHVSGNKDVEKMRVPGGWLVHVLRRVKAAHYVRFGLGDCGSNAYEEPALYASSVVFVPDSTEAPHDP